MAKLDGMTPEQIAEEALKDVDVIFTLPSIVDEAIDKLAKYDNRDVIQIRGDKYWENNKDILRAKAIQKLVTDKVKALNNYMDKKKQDQALEFFKQLRARGMSVEDAMKTSGLDQNT